MKQLSNVQKLKYIFFFLIYTTIQKSPAKTFFFFPKLPLLRYGTQRSRELAPTPTSNFTLPFTRHVMIKNRRGSGATVRRDSPGRLGIPVSGGEKHNLSPAAFGERGGGDDSEGRHLLRREVALEAGQREREVELTGPQLLVLVNRRYDVVESQLVGVAYETRRVELQQIRHLDWVREFLHPPVVNDNLRRRNLRRRFVVRAENAIPHVEPKKMNNLSESKFVPGKVAIFYQRNA